MAMHTEKHTPINLFIVSSGVNQQSTPGFGESPYYWIFRGEEYCICIIFRVEDSRQPTST